MRRRLGQRAEATQETAAATAADPVFEELRRRQGPERQADEGGQAARETRLGGLGVPELDEEHRRVAGLGLGEGQRAVAETGPPRLGGLVRIRAARRVLAAVGLASELREVRTFTSDAMDEQLSKLSVLEGLVKDLEATSSTILKMHSMCER